MNQQREKKCSREKTFFSGGFGFFQISGGIDQEAGGGGG